MKRIFSIYKPYMLHAIFYKGVTRLSVAAAACLVWENFVSDGIFTLWEGPVLVCGIAFLAWAWMSYLSLDGLSPRRLFTAGRAPEKSKMRFRNSDHFAGDLLYGGLCRRAYRLL